MFPSLTSNNKANARIVHTKLSRNFFARNATGTKFPNLNNLGFGKTCHMVFATKTARFRMGIHAITLASGNALRMDTATVAFAFSTTPFLNFITHVIRLRAEKQMGRIHTMSHITVVEHKQPIRDRAIVQNVGIAMSAVSVWAIPELSIPSVGELGSSPQPAGSKFGAMLRDRAVLVNFRPESILRTSILAFTRTAIRAIAMRVRNVTPKHPTAYRAGALRLRAFWNFVGAAFACGCYTFHASSLLVRGLAAPGLFAAVPGLSVPIIPRLSVGVIA